MGPGESYFGKALDVLTERQQWREAATVAREWGRFLRAIGREPEAFDLMDPSSSRIVAGGSKSSRHEFLTIFAIRSGVRLLASSRTVPTIFRRPDRKSP